MTELPPSIPATAAEMEEAAEIVSLISGSVDSLAPSLARDLATGIGSRPVRITSNGEVGEAAAAYWVSALRAAGFDASSAGNAPADARSARIHLHTGSAPRPGYPGMAGDDSAGVLVGEVIGQGHSAAAQFCSLAAVAEALVAGLDPDPSEEIDK